MIDSTSTLTRTESVKSQKSNNTTASNDSVRFRKRHESELLEAWLALTSINYHKIVLLFDTDKRSHYFIMLLVYHIVFLFLFLLLLLLIKLQTLSGDDAPGVDVLGKQISDFDSHTRTWGRREVNFVRNSSVKLSTSVKAPLNSTNLSSMLLLEKFGCFGKQ